MSVYPSAYLRQCNCQCLYVVKVLDIVQSHITTSLFHSNHRISHASPVSRSTSWAARRATNEMKPAVSAVLGRLLVCIDFETFYVENFTIYISGGKRAQLMREHKGYCFSHALFIKWTVYSCLLTEYKTGSVLLTPWLGSLSAGHKYLACTV